MPHDQSGGDSHNSSSAAQSPLSPHQQAALFVSVTNLHLFASGLQGLAGLDTRTGAFVSAQMTPEIAEWAIPYAKRIRDAEALYRAGDLGPALSAFQQLQGELPTAAIVQMNIAVCYADMGDRASAEEWLTRAIPYAPMDRRPLLEENLRRLKATTPGQ